MARAYVSLIQSDYGRSRHGNFEATIVHGTELWHWFQDNSRNDFEPWTRGPRITGDQDNAAGPGCIIQSDFGARPHRNFEVVVPLHLNDGAIELRHFFHDNRDVRLPWAGEFDREGWNGTGTPKFAFNRTESRFGIIGTDLGASFAHRDRLYFVFGDTWRVGHSVPNDDLDSIAFCADKTADAGLRLTFLSRPSVVAGIAQDGFNVPLDGVSFNGSMYVFFSTDRRQAGIYALMGRSVPARSDNGLDFALLYEVSRYSADLAGMYGPYQIPQYTGSTDDGVRIYFTMSAWNPYQVMLMTLDIPTPLQ